MFHGHARAVTLKALCLSTHYLRCNSQWLPTSAVPVVLIFFVCVPPDVISLQLCIPKVVCISFKLLAVYELHLKKLIKLYPKEYLNNNIIQTLIKEQLYFSKAKLYD
jgi:hypothetical protein